MNRGGFREGAGAKKKFVNIFRESEIPSLVIDKIREFISNDTLEPKEYIQLLQYFTPRISAITMQEQEETPIKKIINLGGDPEPKYDFSALTLEEKKTYRDILKKLNRNIKKPI